MKKLMIAAGVAAVACGAFAADCTPDADPIPEGRALVYSVKMSVKTTKGVTASSTWTEGGSLCTPGDNIAETCIYRVKDTTKFEGWIYDCTDNCDLVSTGTAVVWDSKRKVQLDGAAFTTTLINVMGKKQADAEWAWTFEGTAEYGDGMTQTYALTGAGIGKYSVKNGYYTSFSGNFAGTTGASYDLTKKTTCAPSQVWECSDLVSLCPAVDADTVAYGTWTVKYNSSASKKYWKNSYLKVPNYVELN